MLEMLEQRIGQRRDATRALTRVRTRGVALLLPRAQPIRQSPNLGGFKTNTVCHKALNPRGLGTESPSKELRIKTNKNVLTKGGESSSAFLAFNRILILLAKAGPGGPARTSGSAPQQMQIRKVSGIGRGLPALHGSESR